jgi:hypothetical protein
MIKSRRMKWADHGTHMEKRSAHSVFVRMAERRPLQRLANNWKNNIGVRSVEI